MVVTPFYSTVCGGSVFTQVSQLGKQAVAANLVLAGLQNSLVEEAQTWLKAKRNKERK